MSNVIKIKTNADGGALREEDLPLSQGYDSQASLTKHQDGEDDELLKRS